MLDRRRSSAGSILASTHRAPGSSPSSAGPWLCAPIILTLGRQRPKGQKFKVILSYMASLKPVWAIRNLVEDGERGREGGMCWQLALLSGTYAALENCGLFIFLSTVLSPMRGHISNLFFPLQRELLQSAHWSLDLFVNSRLPVSIARLTVGRKVWVSAHYHVPLHLNNKIAL